MNEEELKKRLRDLGDELSADLGHPVLIQLVRPTTDAERAADNEDRAQRLRWQELSIICHETALNGPMHWRDNLAASAMTGLLVAAPPDVAPAVVARRAYEVADAMLAAREKKPNS